MTKNSYSDPEFGVNPAYVFNHDVFNSVTDDLVDQFRMQALEGVSSPEDTAYDIEVIRERRRRQGAWAET